MSLFTDVTWRWPDIETLIETSSKPYGSLLFSVRVQIGQDILYPSMSPAYSVISKHCSMASTADTDTHCFDSEDHTLHTTPLKHSLNPTIQGITAPDSPYGECLFPDDIPQDKPDKKRKKADQSTAAAKKRKWFEDRYGSKDKPPESIKTQCRFFSVGNCKNGNDCPYLHDTAARRIDEPCRFQFPDRRKKCSRDACPFDHEIEKFPCPYLYGLGSCSFDHCTFSHESDLSGEKAKIRFSRVFRNFLVAEKCTLWNDYLSEFVDERKILALSLAR